MKAITALLLIATLSISSATPAIYQSLAEIDKDPIGNTILSALSLNMKAKVPLDDVSNLLKGIKNDLQNDLTTVNDNFEALSERLDGSIENGGKLIGSYDTNIKGLERSINSANSDTESKTTDLKNTKESYAYEQGRLEGLEKSYQDTVPKADADIEGLNNAIKALKDAQAKLQIYQASQSGAPTLLEMSSKTQQEVKKFTDVIEAMKATLSKKNNLYLPLVRELLQMSTNMDQSKAEKVAELLQQLNDLLETAVNDAKQQKEQFVSNYNKEKDEATANSKNYEAHINQLQEDLGTLGQQIEKNTAELKTQKELRDAAQNKLDQDKQSLSDATSEHDTQKGRYQSLLELIQKIITHFSENVAAVDQYTQERVENGL